MKESQNKTIAVNLTEIKPQNFSHLLGMEGFSEKLLMNHFKLYEGYVKATNALQKKWDEFAANNDFENPAFAELKRRFGWEYNSVRLHEFYFENLGGEQGANPGRGFKDLLVDQYGSFERWKNEFLAVASARGIGWAVAYQDSRTHRIHNCWIEEHNNGHLIQASPLLVLDVFEHAYLTDYGVDRKSYLAAFFKNVDWTRVEARIFN